MTIYQRMQAVFEAAGIQGYLLTHEALQSDAKLPDVYANYTVMTDGTSMSCDDMELVHRADVYVDLHGKRDTAQPLQQLLDALDKAGFNYQPVRHLDGLRGSKYKYHKRIVATHFDYKA